MRALGRQYFHLRNNRGKLDCLVLGLFEKGRRQDIQNELADLCHNMESVALEEVLRPQDILGIHNQDDPGWIREVASQEPSRHQVVQMSLDPLKGDACPRVICVPGLGNARVGLLQLIDEREDSKPILHNCLFVSLGHSLLVEK